MGRKKSATNIKLIKGTYRKGRENPKEPKPKSDAVRMPSGLSEGAQKCWKQVAKHLKDAGILTNIDQHALIMYCEANAKWREAMANLDKTGPITKTPNGHIQPSPFISISNKYFEQCRAMLTEFGMTPSSRSKVNADDGAVGGGGGDGGWNSV